MLAPPFNKQHAGERQQKCAVSRLYRQCKVGSGVRVGVLSSRRMQRGDLRGERQSSVLLDRLWPAQSLSVSACTLYSLNSILYRCTFADHDDYTAIGLKIDRVNFDLGKKAQQYEHESTLKRVHIGKVSANKGL